MTLVRKIHIGDSGFREIFGDGFTLEKLNAIMLALAELKPRQKVVVGYDNRFLSEEIAHHIAKILTAQNWNVRVISGTFPTPGVATLVKEWQQDFGLMVTASHNPYYYNGVKIFNESAALISRPFIRSLETLAEEKLNSSAEIPFHVGWRNSDSVSSLDARRVYFDSLLKNVQVPLIQKKKLRVAWDAFGGTDQVLFPLLLKKLQTRQFGLWMEPEPTFHLRRLEPDKTSLKKLGSLVREKKTIVGLATDVDGDRFSILKENGFYILNNQLMSLLTWYLLDVRKEKGNFYQTVSCSEMTRVVARDFGQVLKIFPVGFQLMGESMQKDKTALLAMEETGGLAYGPHLPFKDGFMAHLLVLEMLAQTGKTLSVLYQDLSKKYGKYYYDRVDFRCDSEEEIKQWLSVSLWEKCLSEKVVSHDELDGEKWYFESGSWVLIRRSKTEPLLRIYFESRNLKFVKKIKELLNS